MFGSPCCVAEIYLRPAMVVGG
uniref:Uncharacterized protein n=1 Tax=Arundo donax TaxID=35708 RepID=A0A0A9A7I5_ARUDO